MNGRIGICNNDVIITVEHVPHRKKPCLCVQEKNCIYKVASFNSEETADWFLSKVQEFFGRKLQ